MTRSSPLSGRRFAPLGTTLLAIVLSSGALAQARDLAAPLSFEARALLALSDADMVASAYVDGDLGPREGADALSVLPLGGDPREWSAHPVPASNSVAGPPAAVDVSPDGRFAFVVETWTPRPESAGPHSFADLRHGNRLTVVDVSDPAAPRLIGETALAERPQALRVNHDGTLLAVAFHPAGAGTETPLALYRLDGGEVSAPTTPAIAGYPLGENLMDIDWHPTENILAVIESDGGATLRFARVTDDLAIEVIGNVVDIERAPYRVEFTPDGRHVVVNGLYWGPDIAGIWIEAPRGAISTIRMSAATNADGAPRHAFVSRVLTGVSPEGLAVSPDGRWVATTNLERSYLPYDDGRITWYSSVTLARLDQDTGQLSEVGTFAYDGILPEAAAFDNSGRYLAVVTYDHFDDRREGGAVDFWRIQADPLDATNVHLVKTDVSVPVPRGAHSLAIIR